MKINLHKRLKKLGFHKSDATLKGCKCWCSCYEIGIYVYHHFDKKEYQIEGEQFSYTRKTPMGTLMTVKRLLKKAYHIDDLAIRYAYKYPPAFSRFFSWRFIRKLLYTICGAIVDKYNEYRNRYYFRP